MTRRPSSAAVYFIVLAAMAVTSGTAHAACTSPAGPVASLKWVSSAFKYCDGTNWQGLGSTTSFAAGSVSAPGWPVTSDSDTGFWAPAADTVSVTAGGV